MRRWVTFLVAIFAMAAASVSTGANPVGAAGADGVKAAESPGRSYLVYWDQNEEQDFLAAPSGHLGQLIPPYDPNGQMCLVPDRTGRFVTAYNPTLPSQHNPGSLKPVMQPPVGEALWDRHGNFTGKTIFVPGPYKLPGQTVGGDIPPDPNTTTFNDNGTFLGCAFDGRGDLFATDLATAQGAFPPPDDGRLVEWFAPAYTSYCILAGPTAGGVGPHHVDGTGGLIQPGDLAFDANGDLLLPELGTPQTGELNSRVMRFDHSSFPRAAADCGPDGLYPPTKLRSSVFIQLSRSLLPFPESIARDPACDCWAVASVIGDPAIAFFDDRAQPVSTMGVIHGEAIVDVGQDPNGFNPFGIAFAPDGTLYFVDVHIQCSAPLVNCGPLDGGGRVMKVTFTTGQPNPPTVVAGGYSFPTSVTVCVPGREVCPRPASEDNQDSGQSGPGPTAGGNN